MDQRQIKGWHSRGYLPHFDSGETLQHIVFRTFDSLPATVFENLNDDPAMRRTQVDGLLDQLMGERPLADPALASVVENCLLHFDQKRYCLLGWCVMPNHVHVLIQQIQPWSLGGLVKSWKGEGARVINRLKGRQGRFWAFDYFDRYVRDEVRFAQTLAYIESNPVKAGLVSCPEEWRSSSARIRRKLDREPVVRPSGPSVEP